MPSRAIPAPFAGGITVIAVVVSGVVIRLLGQNAPFGIDQPWHDLLATHRSPGFTAISLALNLLGGTLVSTLMTVALVLALLWRRRLRAAVAIAASVAVASGASTLLKAIVDRARPVDAALEIGSGSFPSGHATTAAALAVSIALLVRLGWVWIAASLWVAAMALSRTYLLVHWASDVVAGAALGTGVALVVVAAARFLREPSPKTPSVTA